METTKVDETEQIEETHWILTLINGAYDLNSIPVKIAELQIQLIERVTQIANIEGTMQELVKGIGQPLASGGLELIDKKRIELRELQADHKTINREINEHNVAIEFLKRRFDIEIITFEADTLGERQPLVLNQTVHGTKL